MLNPPCSPIVAAHYLCTADARDLPSYPSAGLPHPGVAGAAAALLAQDSHRSVEIWRPDSISVAGAGAAASRAHANLKHMGIRKATPVKPAGNALHTLEGASSTQPYQMSEASKRWSLDGAIGAMQSSKARRRSVSSSMPLSIQLEAEAASAGKSALAAAATSTHMPSVRRVPIRISVLQKDSWLTQGELRGRTNANRIFFVQPLFQGLKTTATPPYRLT